MHKKYYSLPWSRFSKKLSMRIERPLYAGSYTPSEAEQRGMKLVKGRSGSFAEGQFCCLYLLVDESDGVIADARFQMYGPSGLIGALDIACEVLIRKNYEQAKRVTADFLDQQMRDRKISPAFPPETFAHLNLVVDAIEQAAGECIGIPLAESYVAPPMNEFDMKGSEQRIYPGWDELNVKQQIYVIEEVIASDIRPYIELDAGGIEVLNFLQNRELIIGYKGSCTSCHSATGATLSAIQQILRMKVHPEIVVTPDMSFLIQKPVDHDVSG